MTRLRATTGAGQDESEEDEDERRLLGVSVPEELGTDSVALLSSFRSRQMNCTSPVSMIHD